jgi:hypothetical protein
MVKKNGQIFYLTDNKNKIGVQRQVLRKSDQRNLIRSACQSAPFYLRKVCNGLHQY